MSAEERLLAKCQEIGDRECYLKELLVDLEMDRQSFLREIREEKRLLLRELRAVWRKQRQLQRQVRKVSLLKVVRARRVPSSSSPSVSEQEEVPEPTSSLTPPHPSLLIPRTQAQRKE